MCPHTWRNCGPTALVVEWLQVPWSLSTLGLFMDGMMLQDERPDVQPAAYAVPCWHDRCSLPVVWTDPPSVAVLGWCLVEAIGGTHICLSGHLSVCTWAVTRDLEPCCSCEPDFCQSCRVPPQLVHAELRASLAAACCRYICLCTVAAPQVYPRSCCRACGAGAVLPTTQL